MKSVENVVKKQIKGGNMKTWGNEKELYYEKLAAELRKIDKALSETEDPILLKSLDKEFKTKARILKKLRESDNTLKLWSDINVVQVVLS